MSNSLKDAAHEALPGPYAATPSPNGVQPDSAVMSLVRGQVRALLESSPAFLSLAPEQRQEMAHNLVKIAAYSAALVQDEWAQSKKLGQTPMLHQQTILGPLAQGTASPQQLPQALADQKKPATEEFSPRAASQAARFTRESLNAIAFPTFVADLIKGTYNAIVDASIKQMEAYVALLANVAMTVDQFMANNITDNQARDYLASGYPGHFKVEITENEAHLRVRDGAEDIKPKPDFKGLFGLNDDIDISDETSEEVLVPAARRQLAQQRHQVLATFVLMGINRIVVTSGRIKAGMKFHIDAHDTGSASAATQFDWKNETTGSVGGHSLFFGWSAETKNTVAYVSTTKKDSSDDINLSTDVTGEVEIKFKSDYFPMERFANPNMIALIQGNTPNPAANTPTKGSSTQNSSTSNA